MLTKNNRKITVIIIIISHIYLNLIAQVVNSTRIVVTRTSKNKTSTQVQTHNIPLAQKQKEETIQELEVKITPSSNSYTRDSTGETNSISCQLKFDVTLTQKDGIPHAMQFYFKPDCRISFSNNNNTLKNSSNECLYVPLKDIITIDSNYIVEIPRSTYTENLQNSIYRITDSLFSMGFDRKAFIFKTEEAVGEIKVPLWDAKEFESNINKSQTQYHRNIQLEAHFTINYFISRDKIQKQIQKQIQNINNLKTSDEWNINLDIDYDVIDGDGFSLNEKIIKVPQTLDKTNIYPFFYDSKDQKYNINLQKNSTYLLSLYKLIENFQTPSQESSINYKADIKSIKSAQLNNNNTTFNYEKTDVNYSPYLNIFTPAEKTKLPKTTLIQEFSGDDCFIFFDKVYNRISKTQEGYEILFSPPEEKMMILIKNQLIVDLQSNLPDNKNSQDYHYFIIFIPYLQSQKYDYITQTTYSKLHGRKSISKIGTIILNLKKLTSCLGSNQIPIEFTSFMTKPLEQKNFIFSIQPFLTSAQTANENQGNKQDDSRTISIN